MALIEKRRGNNELVNNDVGQLGKAPTVRALEDELNTVTADGVKRPNVFRALDVTAAVPTMPKLEPGTVVKHYEFIRQLGTGGMGTVFLARDTRLGRLVAVKLLLKYTGPTAFRFLSEARTTALCRHDNIVVIYDVDEYAGYPYMVLEYIEGRTLRHAITDPGRDAVAFAIDAMLSVTRALVCAHEMGIVHRDLKPENILLSNAGQIKVLDFGIAKQVSETLPETSADVTHIDTKRPAQTQAGALVGTLEYMSPEQIEGKSIDGRTDIWAVGVILYELLAGERPLKGDSFTQIVDVMRAKDPLPSIRKKRPELGPLADLVDRCLQKRKEDRFESAKELLVALERLSAGKTKATFVKEERDVQESNAAAMPQPDTLDAVVPDASLKTEDLKAPSSRDTKSATNTPGKTKRFGRAYFGAAGLVVVAMVVAGVVLKRQTPKPVAPPVVVSAIDCTNAEVTGVDAIAGFPEALGKGACARLGIALGVPWQVTGGTRMGVRAEMRGKEGAHVTIELAGKTAEGTGKTPILATNDAIQKLTPMISVPPMSPERIAGWGARDEASARRIESGFRRFSFGFADKKSAAEAMLATDADSAVPHALMACAVKREDPTRARLEKEEARKRLSQVSEKRAKLIAAGMGTFIPTPDDKKDARGMLDAYAEMSHDPDFAGLYTMCGCILADVSFPMVDWLSKNEPIMGLPITRCILPPETNPERFTQYLDWIDSNLPELQGTQISSFMDVGKLDDAHVVLAIKEKLGAETTRAPDVAGERAMLAMASFDWRAALKVGDELLGEPDLAMSHKGAITRIHALFLAGKVIAAEHATEYELLRLRSKEYDRDFFELAWGDLRMRRLLGRPVVTAERIQEIRERMARNPSLGLDLVPELTLLLTGASKEATAKAELDRFLGDSDPDLKNLTLSWRFSVALPLLRRIRGNDAAAAAYRELDIQNHKWQMSFEMALAFQAIGANAEAERAYPLSMQEPWGYPFDAIAARLRLADMIRADGREDEARELMAIVDKAWAEADVGLRETVRKLK